MATVVGVLETSSAAPSPGPVVKAVIGPASVTDRLAVPRSVPHDAPRGRGGPLNVPATALGMALSAAAASALPPATSAPAATAPHVRGAADSTDEVAHKTEDLVCFDMARAVDDLCNGACCSARAAVHARVCDGCHAVLM